MNTETTTDSSEHLRRGYLFAALTVAIWTGFVLVSRMAGKGTLTAFDVTALRFGVAAVLLSPLLLMKGLGSLKNIRRLLACTLTGGLGYALLCYSGFYFAPAAHGSILLSGMMPFLTAILAWIFLGERPSTQKQIALLVIGAGVACMAAQTFSHGFAGNSWIGDLLFVSASTSWCVFTILVRRWQVKPWDAAAGMSVTSAVIFLPIYLLFLPKHIAVAPWHEILLQAGYQGVMVVIIAMVLYTRAVAELGPTRLAAVMATVPALSALLAWPVLGEALTPLLGVGIALVTLGALIGAATRVSGWARLRA
ncbi:EamA/RhaT family transporter [Solimonas fluminis]|uniref:EamA/RhaT family transporter n=1 Tax=Solimonas fluminis TaxID=2086571 RepID=A0A2S5TJ96_9GAMM|nr:DMT family transporter [Solimonas fluminis]PPE75066.1 EamA/RhaT family transporter [Solimonas fluminis]